MIEWSHLMNPRVILCLILCLILYGCGTKEQPEVLDKPKRLITKNDIKDLKLKYCYEFE